MVSRKGNRLSCLPSHHKHGTPLGLVGRGWSKAPQGLFFFCRVTKLMQVWPFLPPKSSAPLLIPVMEPVEDPPMVAKLKSLLNRGARIEITDGRVFMGQFMCIDHSKNIILAGAFESRPTQPLPVDQSTTQPVPGVAEALATLTGDDASKRKPGVLKMAPPPEDGTL